MTSNIAAVTVDRTFLTAPQQTNFETIFCCMHNDDAMAALSPLASDGAPLSSTPTKAEIICAKPYTYISGGSLAWPGLAWHGPA